MTLSEAGAGNPHAQEFHRAVEVVCRQRTVNPIKAFLLNLPVWDTVQRAADLLGRYFQGRGTRDNLRPVSLTWLIGAVDRVIGPGAAPSHIPLALGPMNIEPLVALCGEDMVFTCRDDIPKRIAYAHWVAVSLVRGSVRDDDHFDRVDFIRDGSYLRKRERHWSVWGWARTLPPKRDPRYVPYWPSGEPLIEGIRQDREQLWAEALHLYRKGFRPTAPKAASDPWEDPWAPILQEVMEECLRLGTVPYYTQILLKLNIKSSEEVGDRITRLMAALFGAARRKLPRKNEWYWQLWKGQKKGLC